MNQLITNEVKMTSLDVAEVTEKRHADVMKDVRREMDALGEEIARGIFSLGSYRDKNNQERPCYTFGKKGAMQLALKYDAKTRYKVIQHIEELEGHVKRNQIDASQLSPELQMFNQIFTAVATTQIKMQQQDVRMDQLEAEQERVTEVVSLKVDADWKNKTNAILNRIAMTLGGGDQYRKVRSDSYQMLENRAKCRLNVRLENLKKEAHARGIISPTKIKGFNKLDVIGNDARLTEIYLAIVKEMAIAHKVNPEGLGA